MSNPSSNEFDVYASNYDEALQRGISLSGESKEFFAIHRIVCLQRLLSSSTEGWRVLDFGCGTGATCSYLLEYLGAREVVGVDVSPASIEYAQRHHSRKGIRFVTQDQLSDGDLFDLVFCNGVFHHIPPAEREEAIRFVSEHLLPSGYFALWENNPWNPGTHWVMARIPFDRAAVKVFPHQAIRMVARGGMVIDSVTFAFVFPRFLSLLRGFEPWLSLLPLGAQYQVLARKPGTRGGLRSESLS